MTKIIDAHQHFWHPARGDYGWMPEDDPILSHPYGPADLEPHLVKSGVVGSVLVQAAPTVEETEYMLGIADVTDHVKAVVGWIDFESPDSLQSLTRLSRHPLFVGVRPMIQDIPDVNWMLREDIQWAYQALIDLDLTFDALGFPQHIDNFHTLFKRYPDMRVVLDHCLKPRLSDHSDSNFANWASGMSRLANETNAYCKLSGLVTEADEGWDIELLRPYVNHVITEFTPSRVMWGSDWPVARLRCEYPDWIEVATLLTADLSTDEQAAIFGATSTEFYRLETM